MGLDYFDLQFRIERTFSLRMPNADFVRVFGAGRVDALHHYIVETLRENRLRHCLGPYVFERLRQACGDLFGQDREAIMPWSEVEELVPRSQRQEAWRDLAASLQLRLLPLRRPRWLETMLAGRLLACLLVLPALFFVPNLWPVVCVSWTLLVGSILLTKPLAVQVPPEFATVKSMVKELLRQHYGRIAKRERAFEEQEIWHVLRSIVVDSLNVRPEEVTPTARWREDLGAE